MKTQIPRSTDITRKWRNRGVRTNPESRSQLNAPRTEREQGREKKQDNGKDRNPRREKVLGMCIKEKICYAFPVSIFPTAWSGEEEIWKQTLKKCLGVYIYAFASDPFICYVFTPAQLLRAHATAGFQNTAPLNATLIRCPWCTSGFRPLIDILNKYLPYFI